MSKPDLIAFCSRKKEISFFSFSGEKLKLIDNFSQDQLAQFREKFLILPSAIALPFNFRLGFSDDVKIRKVLVQQVTDIYPKVDSSWSFSWKKEKAEDKENSGWAISGLAFSPSFEAEKLCPGIDWRLIVPDIFCFQKELNEFNAIDLKTPVDRLLVISRKKGIVSRIGADMDTLLGSIIIQRESGGKVSKIELVNQLASFTEGLERLKGCSSVDLSGFNFNQLETDKKIVWGHLIFLVCGLILIWHFFLYVEISMSQRASLRTAKSLNSKFISLFPGVPAVEPIIQIDEKIKFALKRLEFLKYAKNESSSKLLTFLGQKKIGDLILNQVDANLKGFQLSGKTYSFQQIENLKSEILNRLPVSSVKTLRNMQTAQGVSFSLEAIWKN